MKGWTQNELKTRSLLPCIYDLISVAFFLGISGCTNSVGNCVQIKKNEKKKEVYCYTIDPKSPVFPSQPARSDLPQRNKKISRQAYKIDHITNNLYNCHQTFVSWHCWFYKRKNCFFWDRLVFKKDYWIQVPQVWSIKNHTWHLQSCVSEELLNKVDGSYSDFSYWWCWNIIEIHGIY